jgi:phosphate-selective porin OprO/OprP
MSSTSPPRSRWVCLTLTLLATPAFAQTPDDMDSRIRALEKQLESTTRRLNAEIEALRRELRTPAPAAPASVGTPAAAPAPSTDTLAGQVRDHREQTAAIQSRIDAQVPNVRLGEGVILEDPRGHWALRLTGRMQTDLRLYEGDVLSDTVSIRRARIGVGLTAGVFGGFIETELTAGPTGGATATNGQGTSTNAVLHQAYFDFAPAPAFRLRAGQFKPQFGLENTMTTWQHDFQERSFAGALTQNFLFDRGLMVAGAPTPGVTYGASIMNGTGTGADELQRNTGDSAADGKDLIARVTMNAARWLPLEDTVLHLGGNWRRGTVANGPGGYTGPAVQTEARGTVFFASEPFNNPAGTASATKIERTVIGVEGAAAWRNLKLQGELWRATYAGSSSAGAFERDIRTGYVSAHWIATGEHFADTYRNGIFGRLRPNNAFAPGADSGWGALMLGLRFSVWDASDFGGNTAFTGNTAADTSLARPTVNPIVSNLSSKAQAWTVALKWLPTPYWALMVNLVHTEFGTPVVSQGQRLDSENALTFRGQFDFF